MKHNNPRLNRAIMFVIAGALVGSVFAYDRISTKEEEEVIPPLNTHPGYPVLKKLSNGTVVEVYES